MWELDCKQGWVLKNWCLQIVVLEKIFESPLDCKKIKPVSPKGNQHWIFIERTDTEAETPLLWPPDMRNQLIGKDPDPRKAWGQKEKGTTEDEMVGWHHRLSEHKFEQTPGDSEGQGSLQSRTQLSDWKTTTWQILLAWPTAAERFCLVSWPPNDPMTGFSLLALPHLNRSIPVQKSSLLPLPCSGILLL